jgi:hypothetical protein
VAAAAAGAASPAAAEGKGFQAVAVNHIFLRGRRLHQDSRFLRRPPRHEGFA